MKLKPLLQAALLLPLLAFTPVPHWTLRSADGKTEIGLTGTVWRSEVDGTTINFDDSDEGHFSTNVLFIYGPISALHMSYWPSHSTIVYLYAKAEKNNRQSNAWYNQHSSLEPFNRLTLSLRNNHFVLTDKRGIRYYGDTPAD